MKWKLLATDIALSGYAATAHATTWFWVGGRGECMTMEESWRQVGYTGNSVPSHTPEQLIYFMEGYNGVGRQMKLGLWRH